MDAQKKWDKSKSKKADPDRGRAPTSPVHANSPNAVKKVRQSRVWGWGSVDENKSPSSATDYYKRSSRKV